MDSPAAVLRPENLAPPIWRRWTGSVLLAVLALGLVELHPAVADHSATGDATAVAACDAEHTRRVHVESARPVEPQDCAGCLHRIHSRGAAATAAAGVALGEGGESAFRVADGTPPVPFLSQAPSRGPPRA